jgi:tetratricopeptide (TPR) repeat protein
MAERSKLSGSAGSLRIIVVLAGCAVAVALGASAAWRMSGSGRTTAASIPPRPDLSESPGELRNRIARCEWRARYGLGASSALGRLGELYQANGFYPEASQCYRGLLTLDPGNPLWPHFLAVITMGGYGDADTALPLMRRVIELAPDYVPARIQMADTLLKTSQVTAARAIYSTALARDLKNPYALMGLARCDLAEGNWTGARGRLEEAAVAHPEFSLAWTLMASIDEHLGNVDAEAEDEARVKAGVNYRDCPDAWADALMADCYSPYQLRTAAATASTAGDAAMALPLLARAIALAPDDAPTHRQLGNLLRQLKRYSNARSELEQCVAIDPDTSDNWIDLINLLKEMGDGGAAERALIDGLTNCPDSPNLHFERGKQLKAAGHYEEALADFRVALHFQPSEPNNYIETALVLFHLGQISEGADELKAGLMADPVNPALLTSLAFYSITNGDEAGAREWLRQARADRKVTRDSLKTLAGQYRDKFGREPW